MSETRKLTAILVSDVAGYSRLAGADEDRTLARLRTLRSDLIDPILSVHHGRVVKRTGDGSIIEFRTERASPPDEEIEVPVESRPACRGGGAFARKLRLRHLSSLSPRRRAL